jgi:hypothetical protein
MRVAFLFLLFICSTLLQGNTHQPFRHTASSVVHQSLSSKQLLILTNYTDHTDKREYLFSFESENEDEDISFSRKYTQIGLYFITLLAATFLFNAGTFNQQTPFAQHFPYKLSYIYLRQRVLRI